jgi:hypothetical protein
MRILLAILTGLLGVTLVMAPVVHAQSDVDISMVAETVADLEPAVLIAALEDPMADDALPSQFSDAALIDPAEAGAGSAGLDNDGVEDSVGTVTYGLTYQPEAPATPSVQASPRAGGPERIYNLASVHYMIFDHQLDASALEQFDETLRESIGDQAVDSEVQQITIQDTPAYLISIETEINGIPIVMEWTAIPVDTVAVVSMTMTGGETVDIEALQSDSEALALASVAHLGSAVENRTTPAG